jgi:hypothetical protein
MDATFLLIKEWVRAESDIANSDTISSRQSRRLRAVYHSGALVGPNHSILSKRDAQVAPPQTTSLFSSTGRLGDNRAVQGWRAKYLKWQLTSSAANRNGPVERWLGGPRSPHVGLARLPRATEAVPSPSANGPSPPTPAPLRDSRLLLSIGL